MGGRGDTARLRASELLGTLRAARGPHSANFLGGQTALQHLARLSRTLGQDVYIKRDDATGHSVAGAKARKLEAVVGDAIAQGYTSFATAGPAQSNTCRALAAACAITGTKAHLVLIGDEPGILTGNVLLSAMLGATLHWTGSIPLAELFFSLDRYVEGRRSCGERVLVVPPGCSNALGTIGMAAGYAELMVQCGEIGILPAEIVHASATGGIWAGLELGAALLDGPRPVAAIVLDDLYSDTRAAYAAIFNQAAAAIGQTHRRTASSVNIDDSELAAGYGRASPECLEAIALFARTEGVILDPVYTGQAAAVLIRRIRQGRARGPVVLWHSGGLQALGDQVMTATLNQVAI
jgi:1-aminocyclopropane-1-carboxylate deaminase/D-cysteine desulfhydrase-like pyridoxal-dependent ACC family enzyme